MRSSKTLVMWAAVAICAFASEAVAQSDICQLPADDGPCEGAFPRYFHNGTTGQCEWFIYGGCYGNANNFETMAECEATCPPTGDLCTLPADGGPCDAICPRYFFHAATGQCEEFLYGCCGGNANNFATLEECQNACQFTGDICTLPVQPGPCEGFPLERYYYNASTGGCESFQYSQCGGNANNFAWIEDCEAACGTTQVVAPIPATTAWGQVALLLLVLSAATVVLRRQLARGLE